MWIERKGHLGDDDGVQHEAVVVAAGHVSQCADGALKGRGQDVPVSGRVQGTGDRDTGEGNGGNSQNAEGTKREKRLEDTPSPVSPPARSLCLGHVHEHDVLDDVAQRGPLVAHLMWERESGGGEVRERRERE